MKAEFEIKWRVEDPTRYPYLRESPYHCGGPDGHPKVDALKRSGTTVIGWETPVKVETALGTYWEGRFWWLKSGDPYFQPGPPIEAVLSSSIRPGQPSVHLEDLPD